MSRMSRRVFIAFLASSIGLLLLDYRLVFSEARSAKEAETRDQKPVADGLGTVADPHDRFAMVIDVGACIGCRKCMYGCKEENNVPDTISPLWIEAFEMRSEMTVTGHPSISDLREGTSSYMESPKEGKWYLTVQCNHCQNPPCVKVCPTGATYKDADGLVLMDYKKCIGCRFCVVACPYGARRFNWWEPGPEIPQDEVNPLVPVRPVGVVEKCTFCVHRVRRGRLPRCVEVCPVQARRFGKLNDPNSEVSKVLGSKLSFRLLEEQNTDPHIWYITRGKKWVKT